MENRFKCFLLLRLKEMALRKVAVLLCSRSDILASILKFPHHQFNTIRVIKEWQETVEDKIIDMVKKLGLPETAMEDLIGMVRPIGLDVIKWKGTHQKFFIYSYQKIDLTELKFFRWTPEGVVDYKETAVQLVSCERLDIVLRYLIASYYCLEDYISRFWPELPENEKRRFKMGKTDSHYKFPSYLPYFWPHILDGRFSELNDLVMFWNRNLIPFNQFAFESSAQQGNNSATEYFFQKLTDEEREASLMRIARTVLESYITGSIMEERHSDLVRFVLTVMTPQQQLEIVGARPISVFLYFLEWPWKELFLENAELLWTLVDASDYGSLLEDIQDRFGDPYFLKWFAEYLKLSRPEPPPEFRELYENERCHVRHLPKFFNSSDSESIRAMFKNVVAAGRAELLCGDDVCKVFFQSVLADKLDLVKLCFREATLSREGRRRIKEAFTQYLERLISGPCVRQKFKGFFALLGETDESDDVVEGSEM